MTGRHVDKLWTGGGVIAAAVLLSLGWFFFISPQYAEAASLNDQVTQNQLRVAALQRKLAELRQQNEDLPQYKAQLESRRQALPTTAASSDFLRQLQAAGEEVGVAVTSLTIGTRMEVPGTSGAMFALPVAVTVEGAVPGLEAFLNQLQQVQPRAVLIRGTRLASEAKGVSLTVNLHVFVAAGTATPAATPTK